MGVVYEAHDQTLRRDVAIKMILAAGLRNPQIRARFEREARAIARLQHPGIVGLHDIGEDDGKPFLALELVRGRTLATAIESGSIGAREVAEITASIARAVDHAHRHGIVHRDLKPGNVMLDAGGRARVMDFGLARDEAAEGLTATGQLLGTPDYMAPEQADGGVAIGPAADVHALGAILFHGTTGRRPFVGESAVSVLKKVMIDEAPPPSSIEPSLPAALDAIVGRCLEKRPEDRYPRARDVADALDALLAAWVAPDRPSLIEPSVLPETPIETASPTSPPRSPARSPAPLIAGAVALLGAAIAGGLLLVGPGEPSSSEDVAAARPEAPPAEPDPTPDPDPDPDPARPRTAEEYGTAAREALDRGDPEEAIEAATKAIELDPENVTYRRDLAEALFLQKTETAWRRAAEVLTWLIERSRPEAAGELWKMRGHIRFAEGRYEECISDLGIYLRRRGGGEDVALILMRGTARQRHGLPKLALKDFDRAIELDPENADAYQRRGFLRRKLVGFDGDLAGVIDDYERSIELDPSDPKVHANLGLLLRLEGEQEGDAEKLTRAVRAYDAALTADPRSKHAPYWIQIRAEALIELGEHDRAIAELTRVIEAVPDRADGWEWRGVARLAAGDLDGAIADLDQALKVNPRRHETRAYRGLARKKQGENDRAAADLRTFIEKGATRKRNIPPFRLRRLEKKAREALTDLEGH